MTVDQIIIDEEVNAGRFPSDMAFDYYFTPISHIFAMKWASEPVAEEDGSEDESKSHNARDVRLQFKQMILDKCLKVGTLFAGFNKVLCLLFFKDLLRIQEMPLTAITESDKQVKLYSSILAGARLLFQQDF